MLVLNPDLSSKLIGNENQVFTYAVDLNMAFNQILLILMLQITLTLEI